MQKMALAYSRPLQFSACHGCNVALKENQTLVEGKYIRAQGQFITRTPLEQGQQFNLKLSGTGIIKLNTFPRRHQAIDWVRSKQPLPRGCRRIRLSGVVVYSVIIPYPGQCVLVESVKNSKRTLFTFAAGPATTLAFDIEYGDITVYLTMPSSDIAFDTFCCSSHIKITSTLRGTSAALRHYNPSALCCLEDILLTPGDIFRLDVTGFEDIKDTGSYIRVCVAKQMTLYENNNMAQCFGTDTHPSVKGKRILIVPNVYVQLFVHVMPDGLRVFRRLRTKLLDNIIFPLQHDHILWFELHKVSLRAFQLSDCDNQKSRPDFITSPLDNNDQTPPKPAQQPPPLPPKPSFIRRPRLESTDIHKRHYNQPELAGICNGRSSSETYDPDEIDTQNSLQEYGSYVSADTLSPSTPRNSATYAKFIAEPISLSSSGTKTQNCLCDSIFDSSSFVSIGPDLITLTSLESVNTVYGQNESPNQKLNCHHNNSHYEIPESIWCRSKNSKLKANDDPEKRAGASTFSKDAPEYCNIKSSQRSFAKPIRNNSLRESPNLHRNICSFSCSDCVRGMSSSGRRKISTSFRHPREINRTEMCQRWVDAVNSRRDTLLFQENGLLTEGGCSLARCERALNNTINVEGSEVHSQRSRKVLYRLSNNSEVPTSSVWLQETDDNESVQHNLDICFKPVLGTLRCCSYHSDCRSDLNDPKGDLTSKIIHDSRICYDNHETTTKTIRSLSSDSFSEDCSTQTNSDRPLKGNGSYGFRTDDVDTLDKSSDASDDITHLKCLAQQERSPTDISTCLHTLDTLNKNSSNVPPKVCGQQQVSGYFLARPHSPEQPDKRINGSKRKPLNSKRNHSEQASSDSDDSLNNWEEICKDLTDKFETVTLAKETDKNNELNDGHEIQSDSEVVSLRYPWRKIKRNITESIVSNTSRARLSIGPTIKLPESVANGPNSQTFKRTETLKRNLDTSPRPSVRKGCGTKIV